MNININKVDSAKNLINELNDAEIDILMGVIKVAIIKKILNVGASNHEHIRTYDLS